VGRAILAPEHRHQRVNVVNTMETPMVLRSGTWLGNVQRVDVVQYPRDTGVRHAMLVKHSIQHQPGAKHGNADALSRRPRTDSTRDSEVTRQSHSREDNDRGGRRTGVELAFAAPEYGDTEHGGRAGVAPKDRVSREGAPTATTEHGEQWADPGLGWCRVAGTGEADPREEPRLVEQLTQSEADSRESQRVAKGPQEEAAPTVPDIQDAQLRDENIAPILVAKLAGDEKPKLEDILGDSENVKKLWSEWDRLEIIDGALYRRREVSGRRSNPQLIVPKSLTDQFVEAAHTGMTGGHIGLRKTMDQVQSGGFWYSWRWSVACYCRNCRRCAEYRRGQLPRKAPLQPLKTGAPFERLHIDLTGPHPRSRRGNIYVLTCSDAFSKWTEAFAIPNKEAPTIVRILTEQVFCRFGAPISLLSDRRREIDGTLMREVCRLLGVDKLRN